MSRKRPHADDSSGDEDESGKISEESCSQHRRYRTAAQEDPEEISVSGKIEHVTLVNFLCHRHLHVPFGPNVNFIIGRNGSGKSAIMTGVVVALGGRAAQTSRGLSIKNFVKKGCSSGQVSVQLRNVGTDAYKHAVYGDSIIVERKITAEGGSSYKIKSCEGKVISTSRTEVDHAVDHFNIQIDNPVSLLNQDTSRHLLNSNNASDLYKFFMKATSLEQISTDYLFVMEQKEIALATLQGKKEDIPEVREEVRRREARFIAVKQIKDVKEQLEELKRERVWAEVIENEKEVAKLAATVEKLRSGLPKYDKEIQESEENVTEIEEKVRAVENEINQLKDQAETLKSDQQEIVADLQERKKTVKDKQSTARKLQCEIQEARNDQTFLQEKIDQMKSSLEVRNLQEERLQLQQLLEQKKEELEECHDELQELNDRTAILHEEEQNGHEQVSRVRKQEEFLHKEIKDAERQLQQAKYRANDQLLKFGDWMPRLVDAINVAVCEGKFMKPPRGPIGLHVHVKDQKWSYAIETCLKNLAYGFCVANYKDMHVIKCIISQMCTNFFPVVLVCPFQDTVYDFSSHKPNCQFPTVLDLLDIDDPVITNCLIDQVHIETTLLIETRSLACDVIWSRNAPATQAFAVSGDQVIGGRSFKCIAPLRKQRNYFSPYTKDDIRTLNQTIAEDTSQINQLTAKKRQLENQIKKTSNDLQGASKQKKKMQTSIDNLKMEINELMESIEEEVSPDISVLETDLEMYTQRLEDLSEQSRNAEEELREATESMELQKLFNNDHQIKISAVLEKADPLKEELESLILMGDQEKAKKQHFESQRRKFEQKIDEKEKEWDRLVNLAEQKAETASAHFARVETTRTVTDLETEIIKKQKYIKEEERNRGSAEKVTKEYKEICDRFGGILKNTKNIQKYNKYLNKQMEKRMGFLKDKIKILAANTSQFFTKHLSQRGFSGYISFNHNQETLDLIVNVHKGPKDAHSSHRYIDESTSVMKSLSGGERSVSTICFLTALWGAMESPFRCLDEFDVFMDLLNRKVIMKMVLELAALPTQKNRQFIFLTPQDLSSLPIDKKMVRIFKLDDPGR